MCLPCQAHWQAEIWRRSLSCPAPSSSSESLLSSSLSSCPVDASSATTEDIEGTVSAPKKAWYAFPCACGGSSGPWWWSPHCSPPWTWCSWNMFLTMDYLESETRSNSNLKFLPTRGLSEVIGIIEETVLRNIVRDSKIVTPIMRCIQMQKNIWSSYST